MAKFVLENLNEELVLKPGDDPVGLGGEEFEVSKERAKELRETGIRLRPVGERSEGHEAGGPDVQADPATTPPEEVPEHEVRGRVATRDQEVKE